MDNDVSETNCMTDPGPHEESAVPQIQELASKENPGPSEDQETEKSEKLLKLPLSRIKHIMKLDPEVHFSSQEAVFLIAKATELFIGSLSTEAYKQVAQAKRKTMQRKDIDAAIDCIDSLAFLEGALDG